MRADAVLRDAGFAGEVRLGEPMSKHTSLGIGGPAEAMAYPESVEELARITGLANKNGVPVFYLGNGTNILVLDGGIPGLVINMKKLDWLELQHGGSGTTQVHAGAGVMLPKLVSYCTENGLAGLEFLAGIPGTVGGAIAMNAGTKEAEMKDVLTTVTVISNDGTIEKKRPSELNMEYRRTGIPADSVVADSSFAVLPWPKEEVKEKVASNLRMRKASQPAGVRSAGSTFKNPPGYSAWKLIDMAGMREKQVGQAQVSRMHTNFLINLGGATARDFKALMDMVIKAVQDKLNITLEPEIKIVGIEG
jgi:UDP-N-acetylmuramate dehydrogenase